MKENIKQKNNSVNELIETWSYGHEGSKVTPQRDLIQTCMRMKPDFFDTTPQSIIDNYKIKISLKKSD